ncbi:delta8 fatty acid desaturase-like protein [Trypanosoma theileri]|uniref:Delta8 fatty acid desaturase-like protein n=1 Tax=Trypanosoma theileri TaxID=67003 RepID=A0A1X0NMZ1_9TRYP|nr:delta8 fatty acid desaturase-like protein [Trypanosoma theileri]ORC85499.1 delta8 fatty acid desaturase-like protein [Trypanosoma theileri]
MPFELIPPHAYQTKIPKCILRIDDNWYDCTSWRHSHPGGAMICDQFHDKDATDVFYSLHSKEAIQKLKRMKALPLRETDKPRDEVSLRFEKLRKELEKDGWFERDWFIDFTRNIIPVIILCVVGSFLSYSYPLISIIMIGLGMQQGGWLAHDFGHGRGKLSHFLGVTLGGLINGFSLSWWSQKHNTHHTFPNRKEHDADIHNEPVLYLWTPKDEDDNFFRRYQHFYYPFAYSLLYISWRMQSIIFVLGSRNTVERLMIVLNYLWLACLPWKVVIGSILLGGFCVAIVVTANHQTEEILEPNDNYHYVVDQYRTTRGVHCSSMFFEWFFGGMQYQLEHHLFPMMPRYRYPKARTVVKKFSEENSLPFHVNGVMEIIRMNYDVIKKNSQPIESIQK